MTSKNNSTNTYPHKNDKNKPPNNYKIIKNSYANASARKRVEKNFEKGNYPSYSIGDVTF